ncbi:MAG: nucleotide sugar dehydrogenase [Caulobacteraceae bacterium]|nr:nucleotide sugar dehydrogenase [Caulobacteraceae bacterium]
MAERFSNKITSKEIVIGIVGLGYVGLPLAESFIAVGHRVLGYDIDPAKVDAVNEGRQLIRHIPASRMEALRATGRLSATTDLQRMAEADALLICVPTPINLHREPDLSYVEKTTESLAQVLRRDQIVILESTTYPGTSSELMRPLLERISGLRAGFDFAIAYSPEREDPGNPDFHTSTIPKVVGADSPAEQRMAVELYGTFTTPVPVSNLRTAEAVKLTENIFRLVNIALVNELKQVFSAMDIDIFEVIDAAKTKPFGFMPFYPGPGLGGHCIPIDPFYLTWKARAVGESTRFIELAGDVIASLPKTVIETLASAMSQHLSKPVMGSRILVLGLAYKKNVDDMRESPSLHLIALLRSRGATVDFYDPFIAQVPATRDHPEMAHERSVVWDSEVLKTYDCALIATDHDGVDYAGLAECVGLIVDTRNAMSKVVAPYRAKIVKA